MFLYMYKYTQCEYIAYKFIFKKEITFKFIFQHCQLYYKPNNYLSF